MATGGDGDTKRRRCDGGDDLPISRLRRDCGQCGNCRNMVKFGGPGTWRKMCVRRKEPPGDAAPQQSRPLSVEPLHGLRTVARENAETGERLAALLPTVAQQIRVAPDVMPPTAEKFHVLRFSQASASHWPRSWRQPTWQGAASTTSAAASTTAASSSSQLPATAVMPAGWAPELDAGDID